ncbi:polysaccharide deacetylase family protein [Salinarimonas soli]|uniref:Chitooligosaccharide deacetylase n=1 Tax=Salinarimonas soli TaxID=1638099 RepID=A0A5B2VZD1_9HYPH|nr:polysaccharide deacetylase family protein [Salinarimonas soli]KAA2244395.1 polysaccharide deacetylase family protein [Salinarimonas soli]
MRELKDRALSLVGRTPALRLLGPRWAGAATVIMCHRVVPDDATVANMPLSIRQGYLAAVADEVVRRGLDVVSLDELHRRLAAGAPPPRPMVVFTFDDGYRDNLTLAAPVFAKRRLPWTLFLTTGFPDRSCDYWWGVLEAVVLRHERVEIELPGWHAAYPAGSPAEKRAAFAAIAARADPKALAAYLWARYGLTEAAALEEDAMSWAEVNRLAAGGLVEIGAHTITHRALAGLPAEEARHEMEGSRARIREMTGIEAAHFAYPFGDPGSAGEREFRLAREAGFRTAVTTIPSNVFAGGGQDLQALPRLGLDGRDQTLSQLAVHLSGLTSLVTLRRRHPLLAARPA